MDRKVEQNKEDELKAVFDSQRSGQSLNAAINRSDTSQNQSQQNQSSSSQIEISRTRQVLNDFQALGENLVEMFGNCYESVMDTFDPLELWKKFNDLLPLNKILFFLLTAALVAIIAGLSWPFISFLSRHLFAFIMSEHGASFIKHAGTSLEYIKTSGLFTSFTSQFSTVAEDQDSQLKLDVPSVLNSILLVGSPFLSSFLKEFFNYIKNNVKE